MNEQDNVRLMLENASEHVADPDLVDRAWTGARTAGKQRRRITAAVGSVTVVALIVAGAIAGPQIKRSTDRVAPSPNPLPTATASVPSTGEVDGTPYWLGPEAGSEPWLDPMGTSLGPQVVLPQGSVQQLGERPIRQVAAVVLRKDGPGRYHPLVQSVSGRWAEVSAAKLVETRNASGETAPPLRTTAVAPSGATVAFAQPNKVVVVDTVLGTVGAYPVPSATIDRVTWTMTGDRVIASGPGEAYRVGVGTKSGDEQGVAEVQAPGDPAALTFPLALDSDDGGPKLMSYDANVRSRLVYRPTLPVTGWVGSTISRGSQAARLATPDELPKVQRGSLAVVVTGTRPDSPRRMLVLPDSLKQERERGGGVLGWYDEHTVMFESRTKDSAWLLAWNLQNSQLVRVTELQVDAVALGPALVRVR